MDAIRPLFTKGANLLVAAVALSAVLFVSRIVYNLYFHPLARFPGPFFYRATRLGWVDGFLRARLATDILALHAKYGPVVRIAPNELAFADMAAWKDIYGHRTGTVGGAEEMTKFPKFYERPGQPRSLISETRENHALLRRQLAHGFSDRSMRGQEPIIGSFVDLLIRRVRQHAVGPVDPKTEKPTRNVLNMTAWYNYTTFDIIGDLAFGESFGCLEKSDYHPWIRSLNDMMETSAKLAALNYLGFGFVISFLTKVLASQMANFNHTHDALAKRMSMNVERPDLIEGLLKKKDDWKIDMGILHMNAHLLLVAGSETTATLLCGVTYLLLTHPDALAKVTKEVRAAFTSEKEITLTSVGNLTYMLACLNETLRHYPPVPIGLPRVVPKGGATITGVPVPQDTVVSVWQWSMYHNEKYFKHPFEYHPERFLNDPEFADDKLDALQPFSIGPRNCIGRNLAYAEMRLILARILYNFDIELADKETNWLNQRVQQMWIKPALKVYFTPVTPGDDGEEEEKITKEVNTEA